MESLSKQFRLPLAVAVSRPQLQRLFHFLLDIVLLVGRHHVEAGVDHLGVIFHAQVRVLLFVAQDPRLTLADDVIAKLALGQRVAPLLEGAFGVLHDVALVHEVHVLALVRQRPFDRRADQSLRAFHGNRLERDTGCIGKANLRILLGKVFLEQRFELLILFRAVDKLDARVNIFRVLPEDDHIHVFRMLNGRRHAIVITHRAQADVQVKQYAQRYVQ